MTLKSGYINDAKIKYCLSVIADSDFLLGDYPALTRLAREALTYIIRLERKVNFYEKKQKENKS